MSRNGRVIDRRNRIYSATVDLPLEFRTTSGDEVVLSVLDFPTGERSRFEEKLLPPGKIGLVDYQRCHSQGQGTGHESALGIFYAPKKLNQEIQNHGIEKYLRELVEENSGSGWELRLLTVATPHPGTELLANLEYEVHAWSGNDFRLLFGISISISSNISDPKIVIDASPNAKWA